MVSHWQATRKPNSYFNGHGLLTHPRLSAEGCFNSRSGRMTLAYFSSKDMYYPKEAKIRLEEKTCHSSRMACDPSVGLQGMCTYTVVLPEIPRSGWGTIRQKKHLKRLMIGRHRGH